MLSINIHPESLEFTKTSSSDGTVELNIDALIYDISVNGQSLDKYPKILSLFDTLICRYNLGSKWLRNSGQQIYIPRDRVRHFGFDTMITICDEVRRNVENEMKDAIRIEYDMRNIKNTGFSKDKEFDITAAHQMYLWFIEKNFSDSRNFVFPKTKRKTVQACKYSIGFDAHENKHYGDFRCLKSIE